MPHDPSRPSEDDLIAAYFAPLAGEGGLALKDDAALLRPRPGHDLVLTTDAVVAGVHFFADDPPASIGIKALGVNLSDLAAKGAAPAGFLLTLALPTDWTEAWLSEFCAGLGGSAQAHQCPLLGGDTVSTGGPLVVSITTFGFVPSGRMVRRTTARPGDQLCVTGTIGDAALGLALRRTPEAPWTRALAGEERTFLLDRYHHPRPRGAVAAVVQARARAAMDVSDGLAGDLAKMMRASETSAVIEAQSIPMSAAARAACDRDPALIERVMTGGDDYELLCAVAPEHVSSFLEEVAASGVPATMIGTVVEGQGVPVFRDGTVERRYDRGSFSHF